MTFYQTENGWPFSHFISDTKSGIKQCETLANILPHGSGINGDWHIKKTGKKFICSNCYSAMDDMGGYCHDYDFTVTITLQNSKFEYVKMVMQSELECCGYGLDDYLQDTIAETISYNQDKIKV
jgi:hypothetical protein